MNVLKPSKQTTVFTLLQLGRSQREIERVTGIDRKTIRGYQRRHEAGEQANSPGVATGAAGQTPPPRPPGQGSVCEPWREFIEAQARLAVEFLQRLASEGPCHFGAASRILQRLAEALFRHKDAPRDLARRLLDAVLRVVPMGDGAPVRKLLLRAAIQEGQQAAQNPDSEELRDVQVLMCSQPPWIAFVAERPSGNTGEFGLQAATGAASESDGDAGPTIASDAANNPFR